VQFAKSFFFGLSKEIGDPEMFIEKKSNNHQLFVEIPNLHPPALCASNARENLYVMRLAKTRQLLDLSLPAEQPSTLSEAKRSSRTLW
jgi:hypothetical protein